MLDMEIFGTDEEFERYVVQDSFTDLCLVYIAGYIAIKVEKLAKFPVQRYALFTSSEDPLDPTFANLSKLRKNHAVSIPSQSLYVLVQTSEKYFQSMVVNKLSSRLKESNLLQKVGNEVLNAIDHEKMFPSVAKKYSKKSVEELVKLIVLRYLKFRFLSFTKGFNQNLYSETSKRNMLAKFTLFKNE